MLLNVLQMVFALAFVVGLIFVAAYAGRRWGPAGFVVMKPKAERRLEVIESLMLDPQRRLVLVRCDRGERLLLLGEGRLIDGAAGGQPRPAAGSASA